MIMKLVGKRHYKGSSKSGSEYDFWELYFLDSSDRPGLEGFIALNAVAQSGLDVAKYPVNKDYDVGTFKNKSNRLCVNMMYPVEK